MKRSVLLLISSLAGLSGGLALAHWFKPPASVPAQAKVNTPPKVRAAAGEGAAIAREMAEELELPPAGTGLGDQAAWLQRLQKAGVEEMKEMLEEARKNPDPYERRIFREMVFVKWIREDPEAARTYAETYDDGRIRAQFVGYWARTDPRGAWAYYKENGSYAERQWSIYHLVDQEPAIYLQLLLEDPAALRAAAYSNVNTFEAVVRGGQHGNEAGATQAMAFPDRAQASQMLDASCFLWAQKDPEAALKWAENLKDPQLKNHAMFGILREMANRDPVAATGHIDRINGTIPHELTVEVAAAMTRKGRPEMEAYLAVFEKASQFKVLLRGVLPAMDQPDTNTVLPLLEKYWDPDHKVPKGELALGTLSRWVPSDPAAEWTKLSTFAESPARTSLARVLAPHWAKADPAGAYLAASQSTDPALKQLLANELTKNSIKSGTEADFLKAITLLEGKAFTNAVYDKTRELAESAPSLDKALDFASRQQDAVKSRAMGMVAWVWAERDPVQAMNWVNSGAPGLEPGLKTELAQRWAKDDSYAVSAWLTQQPPGPDRDAYTYGLVRSIADAEPDSAFAWSLNLSDPAQRAKWAGWSLQQWAKRDPAAAWQAVESSTPDEASRAVLRQALTTPPAP